MNKINTNRILDLAGQKSTKQNVKKKQKNKLFEKEKIKDKNTINRMYELAGIKEESSQANLEQQDLFDQVDQFWEDLKTMKINEISSEHTDGLYKKEIELLGKINVSKETVFKAYDGPLIPENCKTEEEIIQWFIMLTISEDTMVYNKNTRQYEFKTIQNLHPDLLNRIKDEIIGDLQYDSLEANNISTELTKLKDNLYDCKINLDLYIYGY